MSFPCLLEFLVKKKLRKKGARNQSLVVEEAKGRRPAQLKRESIIPAMYLLSVGGM